MALLSGAIELLITSCIGKTCEKPLGPGTYPFLRQTQAHLTDWKVNATLSNMETDPLKARGQLAEVDDAESAVVESFAPPLARWFGVGVGFLGPAAIWWSTSNLSDAASTYSSGWLIALQVGAIVSAVIVVLTLMLQFRVESGMRERARQPIHGVRSSAWIFVAVFAITFGLMISTWVAAIDQPIILAVVAYLWFALVPAYFYSRHLEVMNELLRKAEQDDT